MLLPLEGPAQGFSLPILQSPLGLPHVLVLATAIFSLGLFTLLAHRSLLRSLMGLQLILLAVIIAFAAFTAYLQPAGLNGHAASLLLAVIALAELTVGLTLAARLLRPRATTIQEGADADGADPLDVERYDDLKG